MVKVAKIQSFDADEKLGLYRVWGSIRGCGYLSMSKQSNKRGKATPRTLRSSVVQRKEGNKMDKNVMINELNKLEIIGSSFFVGVGLLIFVLISLRIKNLNNTTKDEMKINRLKRTRTMTVMLSLFGQILTIIYCHM